MSAPLCDNIRFYVIQHSHSSIITLWRICVILLNLKKKKNRRKKEYLALDAKPCDVVNVVYLLFHLKTQNLYIVKSLSLDFQEKARQSFYNM